MALGTGLGGSVGLAKETVYGTFVSPTRWVEVRDAKMQNRPHISQGTGLAAGRIVDLGSRRRATWFDAGGTIDMEFLNQSMALLLVNAMGSSATLAQIGTTAAYQLTANLGAPDNQNYFSMQVNAPDAGGNIKQQNYHGCKITKASWTIDMTNPLMVSYDIDSQQWENTTAAGTPSYTTNTRTFTFQGMSFKVGAFGSEATIDGVKKMTVNLERGMTTERIYMGQSTKAEPLSNAVVKISGSADVDLTTSNKSVLWDIFNTQTAVPSIVMQFTGNAITGSASTDTFTLNPTNVFVDSGGTPELDGPEIVSTTINWSGTIDVNNDAALIATLITADTGF